MTAIKKILRALGMLIALLVLVVGGYVLYVVLGYSRIDDYQVLLVERVATAAAAEDGVVGGGAAAEGEEPDLLHLNETYTALTFNIGFGAYNHDFSFFLDEGMLTDGTPTVGSESRAASEELVGLNTATALAQVLAEEPDILLFQEVDVRADRSWGVDQRAAILGSLPVGTWYDYAVNFHSSYLWYPPSKPIGQIADSGLLTTSAYEIASAERRSLPVSDAFPTKYFDLDRCVAISRLPVADAAGVETGELVLINVHPSAYDEGGVIRAQQMEVLASIIAYEYSLGNHVIVGGDFNHAFGGSERLFLQGMEQPEWVQPFNDALLPDGFRVVLANNLNTVATCRDTSVPYEEGRNYEVVLDGFIVSDNVQAQAENIDAGYVASDHNPVRLNFVLLP
jgi:endonuclease/exonuclease/phosphatase family metal-dependent hydrolase